MKMLLRPFKGTIMIILFLGCLLISIGAISQRLVAGTDETYEQLKVFSDVLDIIEKNYVDPVDSEALIHGAIQGMVDALDPHSSFLLPDAYDELQIDTKGEFSGIGIVITMQDDFITVISPIEGTPAHKAGIKAGDKIVKVDGEETREMKLWEAVKKMRGKKGTEVVITVLQKAATEAKDFTIVRDVIPLDSVRSHVLEPGYGYVRISNFRDSTFEDVKDALRKLESDEEPLKGLVLDLRDNPGGLLDQSVKIADLFLDEGLIVSITGRSDSESRTYSAHPNDGKHPYPIVLLINEGSASASEIVAGALQDHGRALILGTTSFGKGSVQAIEPLRDGYALKLTIARYYTPKGHAIQAKGITPDIVVEERLISDGQPEGEQAVHEKDLKNHIPAKPPEETPQESEVDPSHHLEGVKVPGQDPSDQVQELLAKDNQVRRALEILTSWQIFAGMAL